MAHVFAGLGRTVYLYEERDGKKKKVRQVLWGDWLEIDDQRSERDGWIPIVWAKSDPAKRRDLWVRRDETAKKRPLEIIFVDVGQGDGSVLITPERDQNERVMVIDAGESEHMCHFLDGRFQAYNKGFDFHAAILTHPDKDHYRGFESIFGNQKIGFEKVYHNGLMETPVTGTWEKIGGRFKDTAQGIDYCARLWETHADVEADFSDSSDFGRFEYPPVIHAALANPEIKEFAMLSTAHGTLEDGRSFMPGFAPSDGRGYTIEVLGPIVETDSTGTPRLRTFASNYGKTKNGHSVLLRLEYGKFSIFFGGDLNRPAEEFILKHYAGMKQEDELPDHPGPDFDGVVYTARHRLRSEVMKTCHHGSSDVTDLFLDAVNPACFVISSGDSEGHVHPRPDLLGRLGRFGRGESPVILSTELQRSTREVESRKAVDALLKLIDTLHDSPTSNRRDRAKEQIRLLARDNVDVYGAIYVKTDGDRLITAFKYENPSDTKKWFYFEYDILPGGVLRMTD